MPRELLDEREFELVNIIGKRLDSNQRDISRQMDMSLGMVNMILRRLIAKGLIRIHQLNKKKVEYILTPKGFSEKMRKSVKYTLNTINAIGLIRSKLRVTLLPLVERGERHFFLLGESDFAALVETVIKDLCGNKYTITHIQQLPKEKISGVVLICKEFLNGNENHHKLECVDLVKVLASDFIKPNLIGEN